jgi:predicted SprT family Zn-dependent metalloprotease
MIFLRCSYQRNVRYKKPSVNIQVMGMNIEKNPFLRKLRSLQKITTAKNYRCSSCAERVENRFLRKLRFWQKVTMVKDFRCPVCGERINKGEFRNELFMREFKISGLCQECQYTVFGYKVAW